MKMLSLFFLLLILTSCAQFGRDFAQGIDDYNKNRQTMLCFNQRVGNNLSAVHCH